MCLNCSLNCHFWQVVFLGEIAVYEFFLFVRLLSMSYLLRLPRLKRLVLRVGAGIVHVHTHDLSAD